MAIERMSKEKFMVRTACSTTPTRRGCFRSSHFLALPPAEDAQRDCEGKDEPGGQYSERHDELSETHSLKHISAQCIDGCCERQRPHNRLNHGGKPRCREKHSR